MASWGWMMTNKLDQLRGLIRSYRSCLVAYSGGVDSMFLAYVARQELGERCVAAIADTPSLPRREFAEAMDLAARYHLAVRVVHPREFENPQYLANPDNRCYFCKHDLFAELVPLARQENLAVILHGENASDIGDFRPGSRAAVEFQVRAPLKDVGLSKDEIRAYSTELGLPTAAKPQMACLSSRIPYGEAVTPDKLRMIEAGENALRDLGFQEVRVRHHELKLGQLARIEIGPGEIRRFFEDGAYLRALDALRKAGFMHVTVDLQGYRRGSVNEILKRTTPAA
jgi:uncharacterized protein